MHAQDIFRIPNPDPGSYKEIQDVVTGNIPNNLAEAQCGGWDLEKRVNGVFSVEEAVCPPSADEPVGAGCKDQDGKKWKKINPREWENAGNKISNTEMDDNAERTIPEEGLIAIVKGVPGRDNKQANGNIRSGLGLRTEDGGDEDISGRPRRKNGQQTGFTYPKDVDTVCGFTTVCRSSNHPDRRTRPSVRIDPDARDGPPFFCPHPCQRPLDGPAPKGKPGNWNPDDSNSVDCGRQQYYEPKEDKIRYACGGGQTKGPEQGFCDELETNGPLGGLCEDLNTFIYILWKKSQGDCVVERGIDEDGNPYERRRNIFLFEKGKCGFPAEVEAERGGREAPEFIPNPDFDPSKPPGPDNPPQIPNPDATNGGGFGEEGLYECCSDNPYNPGERGASCIVCKGEDCRLSGISDRVIINDAWVAFDHKDGEFPNDGEFPSGGFGDKCIDEPSRHSLDHKRRDENREYISYFRDYNDTSYERAKLDIVPNDDHKKEHIPVACYGMYDLSPEDAKRQETKEEDKRCTIGAYYDEVNFREMKNTQEGKGSYIEEVSQNPFDDPLRPFDDDFNEEEDLWFPELGNAFSLMNDQVFEDKYKKNFTFAILSVDSARQRATVQLDRNRRISSGSLIRAFDDTITNDQDWIKERRTMVEWWHLMETEMHKFFTPPTIRILLPSTWSVDLDPLDPIYTPPLPEDPDDVPVDPRSEPIEIQVEAREDLIGDVIAFFERARFLQIEGRSIFVVVPIASPTQLRAVAQGWETWARRQEQRGLPGKDSALEVVNDLLEYADRIDEVRKLRAELPRYAGALLEEQKKVSSHTAEWLVANIDAYQSYLEFDVGVQQLKFWWAAVQDLYREGHNVDGFPWCRNDRFTTPIYSLLDPWMDGRENDGDTTGGMQQFSECRQQAELLSPIDDCKGSTVGECVPACAGFANNPLMQDYVACLNLVINATEFNDGWPTFDVCDQYFPVPPELPFTESDRDMDLVIDFTAFREPQQSVQLPILKVIQIRIDLDIIKPPPLEQSEEPPYPDLPPLPAFPQDISDEVIASLPKAMIFKEAPILAGPNEIVDQHADAEIPKIQIPQMNFDDLESTLFDVLFLIFDMKKEYGRFWDSLTIEPCNGKGGDDCVRPGSEQDCVKPYNDPKKKCVHFESDLKERLQRIGSRPAIFLFDDYRSIGKFRDPLTHGQAYCEREDWACQLLNWGQQKPREGWLVDFHEDNDPERLMQEGQRAVREKTDNVTRNAEDEFPYDFPQKEMFENFRAPEAIPLQEPRTDL